MKIKAIEAGWVVGEFEEGKVSLFHMCGRKADYRRKVNPIWSPASKGEDDKVKCMACSEDAPDGMVRLARLTTLAR